MVRPSGTTSRFQAGGPNVAKGRSFVPRRGIPDALASSSIITEIRTPQISDPLNRRSWESVGSEWGYTVLVAIVDVNDSPCRFQHSSDEPGSLSGRSIQ